MVARAEKCAAKSVSSYRIRFLTVAHGGEQFKAQSAPSVGESFAFYFLTSGFAATRARKIITSKNERGETQFRLPQKRATTCEKKGIARIAIVFIFCFCFYMSG